MNLTEREPLALRAAITAAVTALVHIAAVYGLVGADAEVAIGTAIDAVGLLVLIVWARAGVTANAKVVARVTTDGDVVAGDAALADTGTALGVDDGRHTVDGLPVVLPVPVHPRLVNLGTREAGPRETGQADVRLVLYVAAGILLAWLVIVAVRALT